MKTLYVISKCCVATDYGIGTYLREYLYCLKDLDCIINLVQLETNEAEFKIVEDNGVRTFLVPSYPDVKDNNICFISYVLRRYIDDTPNVIFHVNCLDFAPLIFNLRKVFHSVKILLTIHCFDWRWDLIDHNYSFKNMKGGRISHIFSSSEMQDAYIELQRIFSKVDSIIVLSKDSLDVLKRLFDIKSQKLVLIPNGIKDKITINYLQNRFILRERYGINKNEKILLFVGRLDKMKGIYVLIESFKRLRERNTNCKLVIVGDIGVFSPIHHAALACGFNILFTGRLSSDLLSEWYQIADIGVIPSYIEQFGFVGTEMMMYGLPIVASNCLGLRCLYEDGKDAKIVPIGDAQKTEEFVANLSYAISELLEDEAMKEKLSKSARSAYLSKFEISIMREKYRTLLYTI